MNEWFLHDLNSHFGWCRQWMARFIAAENKKMLEELECRKMKNMKWIFYWIASLEKLKITTTRLNWRREHLVVVAWENLDWFLYITICNDIKSTRFVVPYLFSKQTSIICQSNFVTVVIKIIFYQYIQTYFDLKNKS